MPPDSSSPIACGHSDIAIALHTPPHRAVSLALVAQAIGAKKPDALVGATRRLSKIKKSTYKMKNVQDTSISGVSTIC